MVTNIKESNIQKISRQLLNVSKIAQDLYQDQLQLLGLNYTNIVEPKLFIINSKQNYISFLNDHFKIQFHQTTIKNIFEITSNLKFTNNQEIQNFLLRKIHFYLSDQGNHYSIDLREKAQQLRVIIFEFLFDYVNQTDRIHALLNELSLFQAQEFDQLLINSKYYDHSYLTDYVKCNASIPDKVFKLIQQLCRLDVIEGDHFCSVQKLMQQMDAICTQISDVMPKPLLRICEILFFHHFSLLELEHKKNDIINLWKHAEESPNLLGFTQLIDKNLWGNRNIFSKYNFYSKDTRIWSQETMQPPIFDHKKVVNWLYRQDRLVLDWLSQYIQYHGVRVSIIALSFIDCSQYHPNIILSALQYFQYSAARIVVHSCAYSDDVSKWIQQLPLQDQQKFNFAQPSILYLDEWVQLIRNYGVDDIGKLKKIFVNLSRVMQAFMQYLQLRTKHLPHELLYFMQVEKQQERYFYFVLQRHNIKLNDFREIFYLRGRNLRESVFSSYVGDFLLDYLSQNIIISKHVTWLGLFYKSVKWHRQLYKDELLLKLKNKYLTVTWVPYTHGTLHYLNWQFNELNNIEKIIEESQVFHHCLATSYIEQIMMRAYIAFHMWSDKLETHLTLGCHIRNGILEFDQLEHPNNQKAEQLLVNIARQFVDYMNESKYLKKS